jgi:hypothetical protein
LLIFAGLGAMRFCTGLGAMRFCADLGAMRFCACSFPSNVFT